MYARDVCDAGEGGDCGVGIVYALLAETGDTVGIAT